jgi:hypothetical protein
VVLVSPRGLPAGAQRAEDIVLGLDERSGLRRVRIQARRAPDSGWETLADASGPALRVTDAGFAIRRNPVARSSPVDQLRIEMSFRANTGKALQRVAVLQP